MNSQQEVENLIVECLDLHHNKYISAEVWRRNFKQDLALKLSKSLNLSVPMNAKLPNSCSVCCITIPEGKEFCEPCYINLHGIDPKGKGQKLDSAKPMWDLLPWEELEEVVKVLTFGAKKYAPENWQKVENGERRYRAAAFRHLAEIGKGVWQDAETGLSHYSHVICCALFASWHGKKSKKEGSSCK